MKKPTVRVQKTRADFESALSRYLDVWSNDGTTQLEVETARYQLLDIYDAKPSVMPDYANAVQQLRATAHDAAPEIFPFEEEPLDADEIGWWRRQARAIVDAAIGAETEDRGFEPPRLDRERDTLRSQLAEAVGLLRRFDTLTRHPYYEPIPNMPGLDANYEATAAFLSRLDKDGAR